MWWGGLWIGWLRDLQRIDHVMMGLDTLMEGPEAALRRSSEDEQAKAKLRCITIDELAVAFSPST